MRIGQRLLSSYQCPDPVLAMEMGRGGSTHILMERDSWELLLRGRNREDSHCSDVMVVFQDIGWSSPARWVMVPGVWSSIGQGKFPGKTLGKVGALKLDSGTFTPQLEFQLCPELVFYVSRTVVLARKSLGLVIIGSWK